MKRLIVRILATLLVVSLPYNVSATLVTISNVLPRVDVIGKPMDIHDGNVIQYEKGGLFYYYGVGYGDCRPPFDFGCAGFYLLGDCGFRTNHTINLYTSPDLQRWTFVRDIFPWNEGRPLGIYYRPKVVYNSYTQLYVLWVNRVERNGPFGSPNFSMLVTSSLRLEHPMVFSLLFRRKCKHSSTVVQAILLFLLTKKPLITRGLRVILHTTHLTIIIASKLNNSR